jgi:hypothetical protein
LREYTGFGWRGSDVRRFLFELKGSLAAPEIRNDPLEIFKKLTATFFSSSTPEYQLTTAQKMLEGFKKATGLTDLGETLTESFIDKVMKKIDSTLRYTLEDTMLKFVEAAAIGEVQNGLFDLTLLERLDLQGQLEAALQKSDLTESESAALNILSGNPELRAVLQSFLAEIIKTEKVGPEGLKFMETFLRGLVELGMKAEDIEAALKFSPREILEKAYLLGTLYRFASEGVLPLTAIEWDLFKEALIKYGILGFPHKAIFASQADIRNMILGLMASAFSVDEFDQLFTRGDGVELAQTLAWFKEFGRLVNNISVGLETGGPILGEYLAEYLKDGDVTRAVDALLPQAEPASATRSLIEVIDVKGPSGDPYVDSKAANFFISKVLQGAESRGKSEAAYDSLLEEIERTELPADDGKVQLAAASLRDSAGGLACLIGEYQRLYDQAALAKIPVLEYLSLFRLKLVRVENLVASELAQEPDLGKAQAMLAQLQSLAQQGTINMRKSILIAAIAYFYKGVAGSDSPVDRFRQIHEALLADHGPSPESDGIPWDVIGASGGMVSSSEVQASTSTVLTLALKILDMEDLIRQNNLEAARQAAKEAAVYAESSVPKATLIRYLPGFVAAAIDVKLFDKEELKIAIFWDRGQGLFMALDLVQDILKSEVYTLLENVLLELEPQAMPAKLAIFGNILRHPKIVERENRFKLAAELLIEMEKDRNFWLNLIDLMDTKQYEEVSRIIKIWVDSDLEAIQASKVTG